MKQLGFLKMPDIELRFTAIIRAPDGARFSAAAASPELLTQEIAAYISSRCEYVLWEGDACRVQALIAAGSLDGAISLYFARVGERWDDERLEIETPPTITHFPPTTSAPSSRSPVGRTATDARE